VPLTGGSHTTMREGGREVVGARLMGRLGRFWAAARVRVSLFFLFSFYFLLNI
jgi:hypothetical protein